MVKWSSKPGPVFYDIITNALEFHQDSIKEDLLDDDNLRLRFLD
jgi:hypothetical protein